MVLITYLPWHDTFIKFMNVLGELKKSDNGEFQPFLAEAYAKGVPEPGASLKLFYNAGTSVSIFYSRYLHLKYYFFLLSEFHVSTAITIPIAQHPRKPQSEFVLQLCRPEKHDCSLCGNDGRASYRLHFSPARQTVVMRSSCKRVSLSNGLAAHFHTYSTDEDEGYSVRSDALSDRCSRCSIIDGITISAFFIFCALLNNSTQCFNR